MLSGLMMDYPLTLDRILEHGKPALSRQKDQDGAA